MSATNPTLNASINAAYAQLLSLAVSAKTLADRRRVYTLTNAISEAFLGAVTAAKEPKRKAAN
jgi:hypothetical protein